MKHYTSIEQSKKLLELGLNPESADMAYIENPIGEFRPVAYTPKETIVARDARGSDAIIYPCWSVGALLEVMPEMIELDVVYVLEIHKECVAYTGWDWKNNERDILCNSKIGKLVDACFETLVWLLENNYIKQ